MIKEIFLIIFLVQAYMFSYSQNRNVNFIISIDGNINPELNSIKIKTLNKKNDTVTYELNYLPGNLMIEKIVFEKIINDEIKVLSFEITYSEICKDEIRYYFYKIDDFEKKWISSYYFILYIYNTNKKKYSDVFIPLLNKEFTYEYDSPEGSMRRVTKKRNEDCVE